MSKIDTGATGGGGGSVTDVTASSPLASSGGTTPNITVTSSTGSGAIVLATSPTLVTPVLGTPTSGTLTNCTLPVGGVTGLGTGVATFLATPSSANLASALTDETGTGANVFANTPTLVTPVLGAATGTSVAVTGGLTAGANGGAAGVATLNGSTSGSATITAPAVAGTATNPIQLSNALAFSGISNVSVGASSNTLTIYNGTSTRYAQYILGAGFQNSSGQFFQWNANSSGLGGADDTSLSRVSAGVIGIGTGASGSVAGTVSAAVYIAAATTGVTAGSFSAITAITSTGGIVTQLTGTSDERLKDSTPYEGGLKEILAIHPTRYRWNEKGHEHAGLPMDREFVGFIAQDVQKAIPEAITGTEGPEQYLSFDDRPILAALVNTIKELNARLENLENQCKK